MLAKIVTYDSQNYICQHIKLMNYSMDYPQSDCQNNLVTFKGMPYHIACLLY